MGASMTATALYDSGHPLELWSFPRKQSLTGPRPGIRVWAGGPPSHPARTPVRLVVWGHTQADADDGEHNARLYISADLWLIIEVKRLIGGVCPTFPEDRAHVASGADYGWSWVAYRTRV
jgi:hypothetical protein